jgi:hypothetical protein
LGGGIGWTNFDVTSLAAPWAAWKTPNDFNVASDRNEFCSPTTRCSDDARYVKDMTAVNYLTDLL